MRPSLPARRRMRGATIVEFAVVGSTFLLLLIGAMELGRMLFYWNSAVEATRLGARVAAVCDVNATAIKTKVQSMLPILNTGDIDVTYTPSGCTVNNCYYVTVAIHSGTVVQNFIPFVSLNLTLPAMSTTLPRESMLSTVNGTANPICN
ncbi:pilus assembly protein [Duganella sp. LX20W]|uniref:Pilus assembly protein n=1 Tax=Rugamonas brunnea TaxID=2758569 RepID=A0A7W2IE20_9BURK|nr:TadE/TadG family type IV pilus assembly protein [Rugamonas brunnea]MBA5639928.1 pilus assembly protein [Rugamonas brunnea]